MTYVQVFPLLTASCGFLGFLLGLALLAKEHFASPCVQKVFMGLQMLALFFTAAAGWDAAAAHHAIDWRLTAFTVGQVGAWSFRLAGWTGGARETRAWVRRLLR